MNPQNEPHHHHYVPQFFLRNFATDPQQTKIATVAKSGQFAVWGERSIHGIGFETELYVHLERGVPVSVETDINRHVETPISKSETWAKIASGRTDALDKHDKPILYALIRHLEARTPHYLQTQQELAAMAGDRSSAMDFTDEERARYAVLRDDPHLAKQMFNYMASSTNWSKAHYQGSGLSILRSPIPLRTSTVPVMAIPAPPHPSLNLPMPGMVPYQLILALDRFTFASLVLGNFDDGFRNSPIPEIVARGYNRHFVGQFAHFEGVRHLVTDRVDLAGEMAWAHYDLTKDTPRKMVFEKRPRSCPPSAPMAQIQG